MGMFDADPKFQALRRLREDEGYTGWVQNGEPVACPCCKDASCTAALTETCNGAGGNA